MSTNVHTLARCTILCSYKVEKKNILQYSYSNSSVENVKGTFLVLIRSCMIVSEDSLRKKM